MTSLQLTRPIAFIDIESTGVNPQQDRIIEIGVIKIHLDGREEFLSSLINPNISIPPDAIKIHGITDADVMGKPHFREFAPQLLEFIKDCDLGGFAINRFDLPLLEAEFQRAGVSYSRKEKLIVDVLTIYHEFEPRNLSAAYKKYCNKELEGAHRSEVDVRATVDVFKSQLEQHEKLPKDILGLHEFCNPKGPTWIDDNGRFAWFEGKAIINFGKNQGKTLEFMSKNDPSYLQWIINKEFSAEVKEIANNAINGKFPEPAKSENPV